MEIRRSRRHPECECRGGPLDEFTWVVGMPDYAGCRCRWRVQSELSLAQLLVAVQAESPCVVALIGPPGSGKSTVAAALAERLPVDVEVLSYAQHRAALSGDASDATVNDEAGALLYGRLADRCRAGLSTVVDGTHHLARTRARLLAIAGEAGLLAMAAVLRTPVEVCVARQATRYEPGLRVPDEQVRDLAAAVDDARPDLAGEGWLVRILDPRATSDRAPAAP